MKSLSYNGKIVRNLNKDLKNEANPKNNCPGPGYFCLAKYGYFIVPSFSSRIERYS
jgi:hypothetical protein